MFKLITLLGTGIPAMLAGILAFIARKWGTTTAAISLFIFLTGAFIACINMILAQALAALAMPPVVANALGMFIPSDFSAVLALIVSAKTCRAAYDLAIAKVKVFAGAS